MYILFSYKTSSVVCLCTDTVLVFLPVSDYTLWSKALSNGQAMHMTILHQHPGGIHWRGPLRDPRGGGNTSTPSSTAKHGFAECTGTCALSTPSTGRSNAGRQQGFSRRCQSWRGRAFCRSRFAACLTGGHFGRPMIICITSKPRSKMVCTKVRRTCRGTCELWARHEHNLFLYKLYDTHAPFFPPLGPRCSSFCLYGLLPPCFFLGGASSLLVLVLLLFTGDMVCFV